MKKEVAAMKKICQVFLLLWVFLVGFSSFCSAEHWMSLPGVDDDAQLFFDGDSAWIDPISRNGGVNEKFVWPKDGKSAIIDVQFHLDLDADEADVTFGRVRLYNTTGHQIGEHYLGRHEKFSDGSIGFTQIIKIASYAIDK